MVKKSKEDNKKEASTETDLTPQQYHICREGGTEPPFSGEFLHNKASGKYLCVCCASVLFDSSTKFDSGSGWPSFWQPYSSNAVIEVDDFRHGMLRKEVRCAKCDAHLGHVFEDGPKPTGLRYCMNSLAMKFDKD